MVVLPPPPPPSAPRGSGAYARDAARLRSQADEFTEAAAHLACTEYGDLGAAGRVAVARAVASLFSTGVNAREALADDDARKKAARKELADAKKAGGSVGGTPPPGAGHGTRGTHAPRASPDARAAAAAADLARGGGRREPLGTDRAWRRYWALPPSDADDPAPDGGVFVEVAGGGGDGGARVTDAPGAPPPHWLWLPHGDDVRELMDALNPRGVREHKLRLALRGLLRVVGGDARAALGAARGRSMAPRDAAADLEAARGAVTAALDAIPGDALIEGDWAPRALAAARSAARTATTPSDLLACLVAAEATITVARYKPWWRLWAAPAPPPASAGTLAPVFSRAGALARAIRPASMQRDADFTGPDTDFPFKGKGVVGLYGVAAAGDGGVSWRQPGQGGGGAPAQERWWQQRGASPQTHRRRAGPRPAGSR